MHDEDVFSVNLVTQKDKVAFSSTDGKMEGKISDSVSVSRLNANNKATTDAAITAHRLRLLSDIGLALSAERDIHRLLDLILKIARELTTADAGSIYTVQTTADGVNNDEKQTAASEDGIN